MDDTSVTAEIRKFIADKITGGTVVHVDWLTAEIIAGKDGIDGEDVPFYRVCAHSHVRKIVSRCIGRYDAKKEPDAQIVMDGFEYMQVAYTVNRNDEILLVPVHQCTDAELLERAAEYDRMARGCRDHGRELLKYVSARNEALAA
jgi:hypothetical protein